MPDLESARSLLAASQRDLQALRNMMDEERFSVEVFGFHAQQVAEKDLKAWLCLLDREFLRTHNIRQLLVLLEETGTPAENFWDLVELTPFAVQFRYDAYESFNERLDREGLTTQVEELLLQVEKLFQKLERL